MKTNLIIFILLLFILPEGYATHNRAGEIHIEPINGCNSLTVRATITTYTAEGGGIADRDSLEICWGDGYCEYIARTVETIIEADYGLNIYVGEHTYGARATYKISMVDPNRNAGILNVNPPLSINIPFAIQTTYSFLNPQFNGCNTTPYLLQPPVDIACVGQTFIHNTNAYDPDGDSLSYKLVTPLQGVDTPVSNYIYPDQIEPGPDNVYHLDPVTGDFTWTSPQKAGEYNIAMIIVSWRNGSPIDTTYRDMQILVKDCEDNRPPVIETIDELCVVAGETIDFDVFAYDPDDGDTIALTAIGAPFVFDYSPADPWEDDGYISHSIHKTFHWETKCEHISGQYYSVVFKAEDNIFTTPSGHNTNGLATLKTVRIKVVGPPPQDLQITSTTDFSTLSWEAPYACEAAQNEFFYGFSVWRRVGSNDFPIDTCTTGLEGRGYTRIKALTQELVDGRYSYTDNNVENGKTYCYRVLGRFAKYTDFIPSIPYNIVPSLPSDEVCVQLPMDVPLMLKSSVISTDIAGGEVAVKWTKPNAIDLDTILNPPPYKYELQRATGIDGTDFNPVPGGVFISPTYWQANDTTFTDTGLNTLENGYNYQIAFYVSDNTELLGTSSNASTVFLTIDPTDNTNILHWQFDVPWTNNTYVIYKQNEAGTGWDSLTTVTETTYRDTGLINGKEYCYYVKAIGSYGVASIESPLINLSNEACQKPYDNVAPCPPELRVETICDKHIKCADEDIANDLTWKNPVHLCEETDDVVSYKVYFTPVEGNNMSVIYETDDPSDTTLMHEPEIGIAGCYAVTALDTFQNESPFSNIVCVDNCPNYSLPNTFTPNGDSQNDLFVPYPYCFIEKIDIKIYNRWGNLIFETENPDINWDGKSKNGEEVPEGTYYYTCEVYEQSVKGIVKNPNILSGYIMIVR